jgi:DNA-binding NarL/FixJ family response regulator
MPGQNGLSVAEVLRAEFPNTKVIILSMLTSEGYVSRVLSVGVDGCIPKHAPVEDLEQAIQTVARGETYFHSDVAKVAVKSLVRNGGGAVSPSQLTQREREVLIHVSEGLSNKEIASQLGLGVRTVETHRDRLMRKLCIHSVAGLTKFAIRHGLVSLEAEPEPRSR